MERVEKQTAVKWLEQQIGSRISDANIRISAFKFYELVNQAKAMEKEQIIESHKQASIEAGFEDSAEDWANEYWERNFK